LNGGTVVSGLMRGLATLPTVDPGAFSGQIQDGRLPRGHPGSAHASVCVAGVYCCGSPWGKQIEGTWPFVCPVDVRIHCIVA